MIMLSKKNHQNPGRREHRPRLVGLARLQAGLTMIEILIVLSILAILAILFWFSVSKQTSKGRDAKRKDDMQKVQIAFEDYYNDNDCYPNLSVLSQCNSAALAPYLSKIPCDPLTNQPYLYQAPGGDNCSGYRVLVQLENSEDPAIVRLGCDAESGCGYSDPTYNYGSSAGNTPINAGGWIGSGNELQRWACSPQTAARDASCNIYADPEAYGCPVNWTELSDCVSNCYNDSPYICGEAPN